MSKSQNNLWRIKCLETQIYLSREWQGPMPVARHHVTPPGKQHNYLIGSLAGVGAHVQPEGGGVGEALPAVLAAERPGRGAGALEGQPAAVGQHMLLQGSAGGEAPSARAEWAAQGCLARVRQPVQIQALLGDAAVAAHVTLHLADAPAPALAPAPPPGPVILPGAAA